MTKREFLSNVEQMIEVPDGTLNGAEQLSALEKWDSMAVISFIAMADAAVGMQVMPSKLANCRTVNDLVALMGDKVSG